jgi:long-chain acyl-CoA synthetase
MYFLEVHTLRNREYARNQADNIGDLKELISYGAIHYKDRDAFLYRDKNEIRHVTFTGFKDDVDALGTALYALGLKGGRIALLGENSYPWIVAYMAAVNGSCIVVPIDKEQSAKEIAGNLKDSETNAVFYSDSYSDVIEEIMKDNDNIKFYINMNLPEEDQKGDIRSFAALLESGRRLLKEGDGAFLKNEVDRDATAVIIYTSGTTGKSKGVMLTHANLAADTVGACR